MFYINGRYCHYLALREAFQKLKYPCLQKAGKLLKKCAAYSHPCLQKLINISTRGVQCSSNPCTPQPIPTSSPLFVSGLLCRGVSAQPINLYVKTQSISWILFLFLNMLAFLSKWLNKYHFDCLNSICIFIN